MENGVAVVATLRQDRSLQLRQPQKDQNILDMPATLDKAVNGLAADARGDRTSISNRLPYPSPHNKPLVGHYTHVHNGGIQSRHPYPKPHVSLFFSNLSKKFEVIS